MKRGIFITFEGPDGSGKSTQIKLLEKYLSDNNVDFFTTREPGGTEIGEKIRRILLDNKNTDISNITEMLLYAASRAQLVHENISQKINNGFWVICDRFIDSSIAYQGYGRNLGDCVWEVNRIAVENYMPDITFYMSIGVDTGLERIEKNIGIKDRIEMEKMDFHSRVKEGYDNIAKENQDRIVSIDSENSIELIHKTIIENIESLLRNWICEDEL